MSGASATPPPLPIKRRIVRLVISLIILVLALLSLIIFELHHAFYWVFSWIMAVVDAVLSIWLVWYCRRQAAPHHSRLWQQLCHWLGFFVVMYFITLLVGHTVITPAQAGVFVLTLLALSLFIAGLYTDLTLVIVGVTLQIMAFGTLLIKAYLWLVMVPVVVVVAIIIYMMIYHGKKIKQSTQDE